MRHLALAGPLAGALAAPLGADPRRGGPAVFFIWRALRPNRCRKPPEPKEPT